MLTVSIKIDGNPTRLAGSIPGIVSHPQLRDMAASAGVEEWSKHLIANYTNKPNKLGGATTGYWTRVRNSLVGTVDASGATITAKGLGLKMKYGGSAMYGPVKPSGRVSEVTGKPIRFLTIPVNPAAHGKTVMDLGGKAAFYLVQLHGPAASAGLVRRSGRGRSRGNRSDPLYFILARQATIKADKNITPRPDMILDNMRGRVKLFINSGSWQTPP